MKKSKLNPFERRALEEELAKKKWALSQMDKRIIEIDPFIKSKVEGIIERIKNIESSLSENDRLVLTHTNEQK